MNKVGLLGAVAFSLLYSGEASAAVKCQMRLGAGCNGPIVYEIQLCAQVTFSQATCRSLCEGTRPICQVSDYDKWVTAYDRKGRRGFHGPLAETNSPDAYDQSGQLAATAGNTYTVCMQEKTISASLIGNIVTASWSSPSPASASATCPGVKVATADSCAAGTTFNNDPTNPKCVTRDSYCGGGGSTGNFASTMSAGFQMVAVQNQHFMSVPEQDGNLQQLASTAGSQLPGLIEPVKAVAGEMKAAPFVSSNSTRKGSTVSAPGTSAASAGGGAGTTGDTIAKADDSAFASKSFAMEGSGYGNGSAGGAGEGVNAAGSATSGGTSWFGAGASATAGGSAGDVGFGKEVGEGGAKRGLAADGRLLVDDPENYFLMSDVGVSLFKRVTAQCRKKERSLVLVTPGAN